MPILAEKFGRVHRSVGTISTGQGLRRTITVAPPTDPFGVLGVDGEVLGHADLRSLGGFIPTYRRYAKPALIHIKNRHRVTALTSFAIPGLS